MVGPSVVERRREPKALPPSGTPRPGGTLRRDRMRGIALLEVLVALLIASLALGMMFAAVGDGLSAGSLAAHYTEAVTRARSRMALALADQAPVAGEREGDDGGGFRWHVRISTLAGDPARPDEGQPDAATLYEVSVWITWPQGDGSGEVRLVSELLGRPPGAS